MVLKEIQFEGLDWIHLAQDWVHLLTVVNMVTKLRVPWKRGNFFTRSVTISFLRWTIYSI